MKRDIHDQSLPPAASLRSWAAGRAIAALRALDEKTITELWRRSAQLPSGDG